jgi:uncharacterized lipoprotein YmbA
MSMRLRRYVPPGACAALFLWLAACSSQHDRFYALRTLPDAPPAPAAGYSTHVLLTLSLPPLVDRRQMVIQASGDQVVILEHERWASTLSELVAGTLSRDIEQRRPDILVADRTFDQTGGTPVRMRVDIVRMSARLGGSAAIEAHWRITDPGAKLDELGGELFESPVSGSDYAAVAQAFSADLSALADRMVQKLSAH